MFPNELICLSVNRAAEKMGSSSHPATKRSSIWTPMSPTSSVPLMNNEGALIQWVLNPPSFCQVTNNSFPPSSRCVSKTEHSSVQLQHFSLVICILSRSSCGGSAYTSRLVSSRSPDKMVVFTSPFLRQKPRDAEICKMSCLKRRPSVGDSERISVKIWVSESFHNKSGFCFRFSCVVSLFPRVNPTHRHDSLFGNASCFAYRNYIIVYPLVHFLVLNCSKLCTLSSRLFLEVHFNTSTSPA